MPATINISMGLSGKITVPSNLEIINNNDSGIKLTNVDVQVVGDWTAVDFDTTEAPVAEEISGDNTRTISFAFRGDKMNSQGLIDVTPESWNFAPNDGLPLNTKVRIPKQSTVTEIDIANINWEFDWSDSDVSSDPSIGADIDIPTEETVTVTFIEPEGVTIKGSKTLELKVGDKLTFPDIELNGIRYEVENWIDNDTKEVLSSDYVVTKNTNVSLTLKEKEANPKNWFTASGNTLTGLSDEYLNMVDAPTDLVIPNNIGGSKITAIGAKAFENKDLITSIVVPSTVTSIASDAFSGTSADLKIDVSYAYKYTIANSPWGLSEDSIIWDTLAEWDTNPMDIDKLGCLDYSLDNSNIIRLKSNAYGVENLNIPSSVNGNKIEIIGPKETPTYDTEGYKSITIPKTVTTIQGGAFAKCPNLKTVYIPDSVKSIGYQIFSGTTKIEYLEVPNSVESINSMAFVNVQEVVYGGHAIPKGFGESILWNSVEEREEYKLRNTDPVDNVELLNRGLIFVSDTYIKSADTKPNGQVIIPTSVEGKLVTAIAYASFKNNTDITSVVIPDTIKKIAKNAFDGCTNLESVVVPNSVDIIGEDAFKNVPEVRYSGTATGSPWGAKSVVPNE